MTAEPSDEAILEKGDAILCAAKAKRQYEAELRDRLFAPLFPRWLHAIVIALVVAADLYNRTLGGILVVIPAWLLFDQFIESRVRTRSQAIFDWIEYRTARHGGDDKI